jgi:hypothetical protein
MICWVAAKIVREASTIFIVMEKIISDAKKIAFAPEKRFLVPPTIVSMMKTIISIVEKIVLIAVKTVSGIPTAVCALKKIVFVIQTIFMKTKTTVGRTKTMVFIDRCRKLSIFNYLISVKDHGLCVGDLGMGNRVHSGEA